MESLPKISMLKFHHDTLYAVRKEVNLHNKERMDQAIDLLDEWVKKQNHFVKKDFSREYLERLIITTKGSVEFAKNRIDKLCTLKTLMPHFFTKCNVKTDFNVDDIFSYGLLPNLTTEHHRVFIMKVKSVNFQSQLLLEFYKLFPIYCEYLKLHDYSNGIIAVIDINDINIFDLVTKVNLVDLRQTATLIFEGYGFRVKGIHFLTPSKTVDTILAIFKQVLSEKIANRLYFHKTLDSLQKIVPKNILPLEYGGCEKSLSKIQEELTEVVGDDNFIEYLKEMYKATTNESCRQTDTFNNKYLGMPGTFRTLSVD